MVESGASAVSEVILDQARRVSSDLVVSVRCETRIYFHLPGEQLLFIGGQRLPVFDVSGFWRKLCI